MRLAVLASVAGLAACFLSSPRKRARPALRAAAESEDDFFVEEVDGTLASYAPCPGFDGEGERNFRARRRTMKPRLRRKLARGEVPLAIYETELEPPMDQEEKWPVVSIIVPTYNRYDMLCFALAAIAAQDYPRSRIEVLVIDDSTDTGSWDNLKSQPAAKELAGRLRYFRPRESGRRSVGSKRDTAVLAARGDVICIWDDDDYFGPERLRKSVAPIAAGEEDITFIHGGSSMLSFSGRTGEFSQVRKEFSETIRIAPGGFQAKHHGIRPRDICTMCYRRDLYRAGFYPDVSVGEDFTCFTKIRAISRSHGFVTDPWVHVRHPASVIVQRGKDSGFLGASKTAHDMELVPKRDAIAMAKLPADLLDFWLISLVAQDPGVATLEALFNLEQPPDEQDES